jgi:hypothetical protein
MTLEIQAYVVSLANSEVRLYNKVRRLRVRGTQAEIALTVATPAQKNLIHTINHRETTTALRHERLAMRSGADACPRAGSVRTGARMLPWCSCPRRGCSPSSFCSARRRSRRPHSA